MKYIIIFFALFLLLIEPASGQGPYKITGATDGISLGLGVITVGTSISLSKKVTPLTKKQIEALDKMDLWEANRWSVGQNSLKARHISDRLLQGSVLLPFTLLLGQASRDDFGTAGLIAFESLLINYGINSIVKNGVKRPRPYLYADDYETIDWNTKNSRYSFYSGHTSTMATMSFVTAQMHSDFYPDSPIKPYVWATASILPAVTAYFRMKGGRHFLTDVGVGYIAGALVGILLPRLHRK